MALGHRYCVDFRSRTKDRGLIYLSIFPAEHLVSVHINQVITIKKHKILAVLSLWLVQYVNFCFPLLNDVSFQSSYKSSPILFA